MGKKDEEANSNNAVIEKSTIKQVISTFCSYTTAHGLGRLAESRSVFRRVTWSLFCIGALVMFIWQVTNLFVIYLSRPVATVVNVHHESHVSFPAVTVCNLNMIRYDKLPEGFMEKLLEELWAEAEKNSSSNASNSAYPLSGPTTLPNNPTAIPDSDSVTAVTDADATTANDATTPAAYDTANPDANAASSNPTNNAVTTATDYNTATPTGTPYYEATTYPYDYDDYNYDYDYYYYDEEYNDGFGEETKEKEYEIEEAIRAELALQNDSAIVDMGHQFEDFVFECSFRGYDCRNYSRYWYHLWDYRYGNCFTFNGGVDDDGEKQRVLQSHVTGPSGGLKLNLFIEQSQYIPELSHTAGARVVIHEQGQMPFPNNEGYSVLPSRSTSFGIRRTVIERADPFGNGSCVSENELHHNNMYAKKFNASYSKQVCMNSCHAERQIADCACAEGQYPADADLCNLKNKATAKCLEKLQYKLLTGDLDCETHCPTPCREVQFKATLSMGHWPSFGYESILESRVKESSTLSKEMDFGYYLSENFLQVRIFYEQLNYEKVTERMSYKGVNLVADIGGQLGLWIGISVLTCCEFLELAWMIIQTVVNRISRKKIIHVLP